MKKIELTDEQLISLHKLLSIDLDSIGMEEEDIINLEDINEGIMEFLED